MKRPRVLPAFSAEEAERARSLLAIRVAHMMGRKFEEGDWSYVYCRAKAIPETSWSNLNIDVMHANLGVEHKMLCVRSDKGLAEVFGTTRMHPSATRSIRVPSLDVDPNDAMRDVLGQYGELIAARKAKVAEQNTSGRPIDMRTGWLLWQESLRQFLYFEEEMLQPNADDYFAKWVEKEDAGGAGRKGSKNLWIYEKETGRKRYSVTTSAGAKVQPYFDIPPPSNPNVHFFTVIGERIEFGKVRVWLTLATAKELERIIGSLDFDTLSDIVLNAAHELSAVGEDTTKFAEPGVSVLIREEAYSALTNAVQGVSDEHCFRMLLEHLESR